LTICIDYYTFGILIILTMIKNVNL